MDNFRGAAFMVSAMLAFALLDAVIKALSGAIPAGQLVSWLGLTGAVLFSGIAIAQGQPLLSRSMLKAPIILRNLGELSGTLCFITALTLVPLATASAILQAAPLIVTLGAALFLGEKVGWRRWLAICVGFVGVLIIMRPGLEGFDANALYAVFGMLGLAIRDLATRRVPRETSSSQLSLLAFLVLIPAGAILLAVSDQPPVMPDAQQWGILSIAIVLNGIAYFTITSSMRVGDISFVSPFRYTRIIFALVIGIFVFGEVPDLATYVGAFIVVASGLYTLWREQVVKSRQSV